MIPFPVNEPELWPAYVPAGVTQYLRLFSEWGGTKLDRMREAGYEVVVLDEGVEKEVSGVDVRAAMRAGGEWEALVPPGVARVDPLARRAVSFGLTCFRSSCSCSTGLPTARTTSLGGRSGLEAATTPNLDRLCARGLVRRALRGRARAAHRRARSRTGRCSATAPTSSPGRAVFEALGRGQEVEPRGTSSPTRRSGPPNGATTAGG